MEKIASWISHPSQISTSSFLINFWLNKSPSWIPQWSPYIQKSCAVVRPTLGRAPRNTSDLYTRRLCASFGFGSWTSVGPVGNDFRKVQDQTKLNGFYRMIHVKDFFVYYQKAKFSLWTSWVCKYTSSKFNGWDLKMKNIPKGISFSRSCFSGSMLKFRDVQTLFFHFWVGFFGGTGVWRSMDKACDLMKTSGLWFSSKRSPRGHENSVSNNKDSNKKTCIFRSK